MHFFTKRRFNWIDIVCVSVVFNLVKTQQYVAAAVVFFVGGIASVLAEKKWGE